MTQFNKDLGALPNSKDYVLAKIALHYHILSLFRTMTGHFQCFLEILMY